jgi:hypothetical protein
VPPARVDQKNTPTINTNHLTKKHATSTNSPTHFPFHFNKENISKQIKSTTGGENIYVKTNNNASNYKNKDEVNKTKPVVSLKLNLYHSNLKSKEISLKGKDKKLFDPNRLDSSIENLDNSTTSIKSTLRESKYYKKEAEKISSYVKQCKYFIIILDYLKYGEYPVTSMKFYKYGRVNTFYLIFSYLEEEHLEK